MLYIRIGRYNFIGTLSLLINKPGNNEKMFGNVFLLFQNDNNAFAISYIMRS